MDNIRRVGKILHKNTQEAAQNIRRIAENFPQVERIIDNVSPQQKFKGEFTTSNKPHTVSMDFNVKEIKTECLTSAVEEYVSATLNCPDGFVGGLTLGYEHETIWSGDPNDPYAPTGFVSNIGGFTFGSPGGVVVPISGIYSINAEIAFGGVCVGNCYHSSSLRRNGFQTLDAKITYGGPYTGHNLYALTYCNAGDRVGTFVGANDIAFFTPYNLCWLGPNYTTITLVGLP